ncbi:hypothetical protein AGMMS49940_22110 [Spirochaetia bacterium]|nr:hypothetical protein AGMMS49940_22110 [Spirochaetia bacterium]
MRDCFFYLADKNMKFSFEGFLTRPDFYKKLGCGPFAFDPQQDAKVAAGDNDPGLCKRGHELLRLYQATHHHAVVVLDAQWDGSPGKEKIAERLYDNIIRTGWPEGSFQVIVIDPELENWIWQQHDDIARNLQFANRYELMADPDLIAAWPTGQDKPTFPKEIFEKLLRKKQIQRSSVLYKQITSQIPVRGCRDPAFLSLVETLQRWFPVEPEGTGGDGK